MHYSPTCTACRDCSPETFYVSCQGCQTRKARIEAERKAPVLTDAQVAGADSTFGDVK